MPEEVEISSLSFGGDPTKLPTTKQLPIGDIIVTIKSFKAIKSGEPDDGARAQGKVGGKLAIEMQVAVSQPPKFKGILGRKTFWIGDDACPMPSIDADSTPQQVALAKATWERNGTDLMAALKHAGVGLTPSTKPAEACAAAVEQQVGIHTYLKGEKPNPKGGVYAARVEVGSFWKAGTRAVKVQDDARVEVGDSVAVAPSTEGLSASD